MTCGSKKHIAEALAKINVHEIEDQKDLKSEYDVKSKRKKLLQT